MKPVAPVLSHARLLELLSYDPDTGIFTRLVDRGRYRAGTPAGSIKIEGYLTICVDGHECLAHRLAWFYVTGNWPVEDVDHIDYAPSNNRFANLRLATRAQTTISRKKPRGSKNSLKGVAAITRKDGSPGFTAQVTHKGEHLYLGCFLHAHEAHAAYRIAASCIFGEFARYE